jgi:DNA replication protein DnaC
MVINTEQFIQHLKASGAIAPDAAEEFDLNKTALYGVDCKICGNKGYTVVRLEGNMLATRECSCMVKRRAMMETRKSGLDGIVSKYTWKAYSTPDQRTEEIKKKALEYIRCGAENWFYISGIPGSGKTHICTAICSALLASGKQVKYVIWRELAQQLKASLNTPEYQALMDSLKRPEVLYIDDLLKGSVTEADENRALEIVNARYNMPGKRTIISSERDLSYIRSMDEAVGGRIYERCGMGRYCFKSPNKNWRA